DNPGIGSVLLIKTGKNDESGIPAVIIDGSAMMNISIFYPEQDVSSPIPYSPCISLRGMSSIQNITLVNPYVGIVINSPESVTCTKNIYMTPLSYGILADNPSADIAAEKIIISPDCWASFNPSSAPGGYKALTSAEKAALSSLLKNNSCGIKLNNYNVFRLYGGLVSRLNTGVLIDCANASSGAVANVTISECKYGVVSKANTQSGFQITDSIISYATACVDIRPGASGVLKLNMCEFYYSEFGIFANGLSDSVLSAANCVFYGTTNSIQAISGSFSVMQCSFLQAGQKIYFANTVSPSVYIGNTGGSVTCGLNVLNISANPGFTKYSKFKHQYKSTLPRPYTNHLYNVLDFGAVPSEPDAANWTDCTAAFRAALEAAGKTGGTVFIPEGVYHLTGTLVIPEGVELRGIYSAQTVNAR
ncbi:MAG TPA: glycosyl hydrolase family 28-related protein, partial [Clostridia bacterium]|nr:glycosyl hydrolase family 28-related protein [Clostridia bacterium]